ncbi:MAG: cupin domain-containing protein [Deltaproteobacteria bacterium]|nr:cupin domain-containing protein [Deltaproteobacteria bacterium]MBW2137236.1 cupin domain-containing protein [Deltaproteobacteria bacterium]
MLPKIKARVVFSGNDSVEVGGPVFSPESIQARRLTPIDFDTRTEPYLIEIPPYATVSSHFFPHKGEEVGYLLSGHLELKIGERTHTAKAGDIIYLTSQMPSGRANRGSDRVKLLWFKVK